MKFQPGYGDHDKYFRRVCGLMITPPPLSSPKNVIWTKNSQENSPPPFFRQFMMYLGAKKSIIGADLLHILNREFRGRGGLSLCLSFVSPRCSRLHSILRGRSPRFILRGSFSKSRSLRVVFRGSFSVLHSWSRVLIAEHLSSNLNSFLS